MTASSASVAELKAWKAFVSQYRENRSLGANNPADTTSLLLLISAMANQYIGSPSSFASTQSLYQKCASSLVRLPQFPLSPLRPEHNEELPRLVEVMQKQFASLIDDPLMFGYTYQYWCAVDRKTAQANIQSANKSIDSSALSAFTQIYTPLWVVDYILANTMLAAIKSPSPWLLPTARCTAPSVANNTIASSDTCTASIDGRTSNTHSLTPVDARSITVLDPACGAGNFLIRAFDELFELQVKSGVAPDEAATNILEHQLAGTDIDPLALAILAYAIVARCEKNGVRIIPALKKIALALPETAAAPTKTESNSGADSSKHSTQPDGTLGSLARNWSVPHPLADQYDVVVTNPPYIGRKLISRDLKDLLKKNFPDANQDLSTAFLRRSLEFLAPGGRLGLITQASMMFLPSHGKLRKYILEEFELVSVVDAGPGVFPLQGGEKVNSGIFVIERTFEKSLAKAPGKLTIESSEKSFGKEPETPAPGRRTLSDEAQHSSIFIDVRKTGDKEAALLGQIESIKSSLETSNLSTESGTVTGDASAVSGGTSADSSRVVLIPPAVFYRFHKCAFNYHVPACVSRVLEDSPTLEEIADIRQGLATSDNNRFVKMLWEVTPEERSSRTWVPYVKGAGGERWYSPVRHAVNWASDGKLIKDAVSERYPYLKGNIAWVVKNEQFYFRRGLCFSFVNTKGIAVRLLPPGCIFDVGASAVFSRTELPIADSSNEPRFHGVRAADAFLMGYLNSSFIVALAASLNPTINYQVGDLKRLPHIRFEVDVKKRISEVALQCAAFKRKLASLTDPSSWFDWTVGGGSGALDPAGFDQTGLDQTEAQRDPKGLLSAQFRDFEKTIGEVHSALYELETSIDRLVLESVARTYRLNSTEVEEISRWTREYALNERQDAKLKLDNVFVDVVLSKRALVPEKNGYLTAQRPEDSQWLSEKLKRDSCEYFENSFPERLTKLFYGRLPVSIT